MQISSKLFNQQQLKQFSSTTEELQDLQNKIATGENILRASDDPVGSVELSGLNVVKKQIEKYERNVNSANDRLSLIDKNLESDDNSILNYFDKIITISDLEKEDVNLIKLKKAIFISSYGKEDKLLELLNPIINSDSVWKVQATKFMGDYYFSRKEYVKADQFYSKLINLEGENIDKNEINRKIQTYKK